MRQVAIPVFAIVLFLIFGRRSSGSMTGPITRWPHPATFGLLFGALNGFF